MTKFVKTDLIETGITSYQHVVIWILTMQDFANKNNTHTNDKHVQKPVFPN